jgi:hypothetical protein
MMRAAEQRRRQVASRRGHRRRPPQGTRSMDGVWSTARRSEADCSPSSQWGPWSLRACGMAAAAGGLRAAKPQPGLRHRQGGAGRRPLSRLSGGERNRRHSRSLPARLTAAPMSPPSPRQAPLPVDPADVKPIPGAIDRLQTICERLSTGVPCRTGSSPGKPAFVPVTQDGLPLIGKVPGSEGRLYRDRAQRLGHPQRTRHRRGHGRTDCQAARETTDLTPFDPPAFARSIRRRSASRRHGHTRACRC